jgi:hypothetical protein
MKKIKQKIKGSKVKPKLRKNMKDKFIADQIDDDEFKDVREECSHKGKGKKVKAKSHKQKDNDEPKKKKCDAAVKAKAPAPRVIRKKLSQDGDGCFFLIGMRGNDYAQSIPSVLATVAAMMGNQQQT